MNQITFINHLSSGLSPESFSILDKIGEGSFGKVFKAVYGKDASKKYALKRITLKDSDDNDEASLDEIKNELQILEKISKVTPKPASILPFHGYFIQESAFKDRDFCFVFDLLDKSLSKLISERKKSDDHFKVSDLRRFYQQLLHGMAFLQSIGVSHRDLKPGNLMMDGQGNFRIIDFGLSVNILELLKAQPQGQSSKTKTKVLIEMGGTESYFSPEMLLQWENPQVNEVELNSYKSDVFSFGLILLEAATFRKIEHPNNPAKQRTFVKENLQKFAATADSYSNAKEKKDFKFLLTKLERCLAFDPQNRPNFLDLFKEDLEVGRIPHHIWVEEQAPAVFPQSPEEPGERE